MKHIDMQIKFEGQTHQIDANTLINVLIHYQSVIIQANKELSGGSRTVEMKVNAIEKGSFLVDISLNETIIEQIFSKDTFEYLSALSGVVSGVFGAYKLLKGKKANTEEEKVLIKGDNNNTTINQTIVKVYNQPIVREAISKSIETADNDVNVEGLSIDVNKDSKPIVFKKQDFKSYIYDDFDKEEDIPDEKEEIVETHLTIISLNFEAGSKWQFLYNGFKISMTVKDDALMKKIDEGERFGKGDAINVQLKIVKRYNPTYKAYENKSYKILAFLDHIEAPKQEKLF